MARGGGEGNGGEAWPGGGFRGIVTGADCRLMGTVVTEKCGVCNKEMGMIMGGGGRGVLAGEDISAHI